MNSFVFPIGMLFGLNIVLRACEGTIFLPPEGDTFIVAPGTDVTLAWTYNDTNVDDLSFLDQNGASLAEIFSSGTVKIEPRGIRLGVGAAPPASLILKNVETRHNGTYSFRIIFGKHEETSSVTVFVAVPPTVTTNCSSPITVDIGDDVTCLCKAEDANPPGNVNVTWYKGDVKHGVTKKEENMLSLSDVETSAEGTFKCVAQSLTLTNETSINVTVNFFSPEETSLTSSPTTAVLGQSVTISCEASGHPEPTFTIYHNCSKVGDEMTYKIDVVRYSDAGFYRCVAMNKLGNGSDIFPLDVISPVQPTTLAVPTTSSSNNVTVIVPTKYSSDKMEFGSNVVVWHVVVSLLSGIVIGVLLSQVLGYSRRQFRNKKLAQSKPKQQTTGKGESIYQDLDLNKMNEDENYQSLRGVANSGDGESAYAELNDVRHEEENYQTFTKT